MSRKVRLTKTAEIQLANLLKHLEQKWSQKAKLSFVKKLDKRIDKVKLNPNLFPRSFIKKGLHKCVVTKQTTFYYIHDQNTITVLTIFDSRQNPEKTKSQIEGDES